MPVVFDAVGTSAQTATVSLSVAITLANNAVLLAFIGGKAAASASSVAYGGVNLTRLGYTSATTNMVLEVWGLTAPASGANNLVANFPSAGTRRTVVGISYLNARAVNPFGKMASATASAVSVAMNVSGTVDGVVVGGFACAAGISATNLLQRSLNNADMGFFVGETAGAGVSTALSARLQGTVSASWANAGICVYFSAAAVTSPYRFLTTMGAGS